MLVTYEIKNKIFKMLHSANLRRNRKATCTDNLI